MTARGRRRCGVGCEQGAAVNHRYFVAHRLLWRPSNATTRGLWEGAIAAGLGRNFSDSDQPTLRAGLRGVSGNGGVHFIHNAGHVTGASDTKWVGSLTLAYRFHMEGVLP